MAGFCSVRRLLTDSVQLRCYNQTLIVEASKFRAGDSEIRGVLEECGVTGRAAAVIGETPPRAAKEEPPRAPPRAARLGS